MSFSFSDIAKLEEILTNYKGYKDFLFKLSPPAWQNEQKSKAVKPEVVADEDGQDDQHKEPDEIAIRNGTYFTLARVETK